MSSATTDAAAPPTLSIVVLVYNTAQFLEECFDSLLAQQYRNIEIIAIDDASTDGSPDICRRYAAQYANFRVIEKANEGGAVSGNLGIAQARGDYVALVDSDDLVTPEGYLRLMDEAMTTGADIVIGRAARLIDGVRSSVAFLYEPYVWSRRRVLDSVHEFPDLIHDGFYWNKVFRTAFLREHGLGMVPGLLYADRPFVHKAYYLSRRTAIIPDLVYLWRSRPTGTQPSITQRITDAANFTDRMRSVAIEWHDFDGVAEADDYRRSIAVTNLQRALFAASGMAGSPAFRAVYVPAMQRLLALYGALDYRALGPRRSLYLALIDRGEVGGLCFLLGMTSEKCWIAEIDGAVYWQQPFLDNPEVPVAREVMRLDFPIAGFFRLGWTGLGDHGLRLELDLHEAIMARCSVGLSLQSLDGEDLARFVPQGRLRANTWGYDLDTAGHAWEPGELYGLVLHYRSGQVEGRYRIGKAMLQPEQLPTLPQRRGPGMLLYAPEAGGLGFRAD